MKLIDINIKRWHRALSGNLLQDDANWLLMQYIPIDFLIDGTKIIHKQYIKNIIEINNEAIDNKIMELKLNNLCDSKIPNIPLHSDISLFEWLEYSKIVIEIGLHTDEFILIGKVIKANKKSFVLEKINRNAEIYGRESLKYDIVRTIGIGTDYLNSYELYLNSIKHTQSAL